MSEVLKDEDVSALTPGSKEAERVGCLCPIFSNDYGKGFSVYNKETLWFIATNCPLHGEAVWKAKTKRERKT